ncbi:MAG TPA: hypothetical protein VK817_22590 [Trebonia sp.]|jgi:hypothetical protein|nr:hypothetical protein [Trebonia sp.]
MDVPADAPADVSAHLSRLRDGLVAATDLRGLYLYGSLTTGDFSPSASDIDVIAVTGRQPGPGTLRVIEGLHQELASSGGAFARLNCLYVPAGELADPERLHTYWYGDRFTEWELKLMTMAELAHAGRALHGPWPPPGLPPVRPGELRAHVRDQLDTYWRRMTARPDIWLHDQWVDFGLVTLSRTAALMRDGELITKSAAIRRLGDFGVPDWLADQIRRRRAGEEVPASEAERLTRADLARRLMTDGIRQLTGE